MDETVALVQFATFFITFPVSPLVALISMFLTYLIERLETLNSQRPIELSMRITSYYTIMNVVSHWLIIFSCSAIIINLMWMEYLFPNIVLAIDPEVSVSSFHVIKYATIIILVLVYELISLIGKAIGRSLYSTIDRRKITKVEQKFSKQKDKNESTVKIRNVEPLQSISRTFNKELIAS